MPFLAYKCVVIAAGELLDSGSDEDTTLLLTILTASAVAMLACVVVFKPFRDKEDGQEGFSGADKAEIIALASMLLNLATGWVCWLIKQERPLKFWEELVFIIIGLLCVCAPLVYMRMQWSKARKQQEQELEDGDQEQGNATKNLEQKTEKKAEKKTEKKTKKKTEKKTKKKTEKKAEEKAEEKTEKKTDGQVVAFDNPVVDEYLKVVASFSRDGAFLKGQASSLALTSAASARQLPDSCGTEAAEQ